MAARDSLEQARVRSLSGRGFAFDHQAQFHSAPLHLHGYEPGHRQAGGVSGLDRVGDQSL